MPLVLGLSSQDFKLEKRIRQRYQLSGWCPFLWQVYLHIALFKWYYPCGGRLHMEVGRTCVYIYLLIALVVRTYSS